MPVNDGTTSDRPNADGPAPTPLRAKPAAKTPSGAKAAGDATPKKPAGRPDDRRAAPRMRSRVLTDGDVAAHGADAGHSFLGSTVNLSPGGCLVRTYEALETGMGVTMTMRLPEGDLCVQGKIVHVDSDAVGCRMAGIRFHALGTAAQTILTQHLATFIPAPPPAGRSPSPALTAAGGGSFPVEGRVERRTA